MTPDEQIKQLQNKGVVESPDLWYILKDEDGLRPLAGMWPSSGYGKEDAEAKAKKGTRVVKVRIIEV